MKRKSFRRSRNEPSNDSVLARRKARQDAIRHNELYDPQRQRSDSEIATMRAAAVKHPGGKADLMLRGLGLVEKPKKVAPKPRAKKSATAEASA